LYLVLHHKRSGDNSLEMEVLFKKKEEEKKPVCRRDKDEWSSKTFELDLKIDFLYLDMI